MLEMSVDEAIEFFGKEKSGNKKNETSGLDVAKKIQALSDVGLGYIKLGAVF